MLCLQHMRPVSIITRIAVRIARLPHSRGFGVQSPSAYRFVRYVVNESLPYYAYAAMRHSHPRLQWHERKMGELYLRLANFCQADILVSFGATDAVLRRYIRHGCRATQVAEHGSGDTANSSGAWRFIRVSEAADADRTFGEILTHADSDTVLIVEDIKRDADARRLWQLCTESGAVSVSYDLYYCGIAFFDTRRHKQTHIVNF